MGYENRDYYRDSADWGKQWTPDDDRPTRGPGGIMQGPQGRSVVISLIVINVAIAILDLFTPIVVSDAGNSTMPSFQDAEQTSEPVASGDSKPTSLTSSTDAEGTAPPATTNKKKHWLAHFLSLKSSVFTQPWQFFTVLTYGFTHSTLTDPYPGFFHILFNMVMLFFLGRPLEARLGWYEFLRFYLVAIVVAGLGYLLVSALFFGVGYPRSVVGASGAVSAVVILFVMMYPREKLFLFGIWQMPAWILGVAMLAIDILRSLDPTSGLAVETHLAGAAFGAAYHHFKWNLRWMRLEKIAEMFKSRPRLKVHSPGPDPELQAQADEILAKINEQGQDSLTSRERRVLKKYSQQVRQSRD